MSQAVFNLKSVYFLSTSFSNSGYSKPFFVVYWYAYVPSKTERLAADPVNCVDLWGLSTEVVLNSEGNFVVTGGKTDEGISIQHNPVPIVFPI